VAAAGRQIFARVRADPESADGAEPTGRPV